MENLRDVSPHPPGDQIDRSIVVNQMLKDLSTTALRIGIIGALIYAVAHVAGNFWQGILPVLLALIVCTVLAPFVTAMRSVGIPAGLAAVLAILSFFGIIGAIISFIAPSFMAQSQSLYLQTVEGIQRLQLWVQGPPLNLDSDQLGVYINELISLIQQRAGTIAGSVFSGIGTVTSFVVTLVIVIVLTVFFLKDGHKFLGWLRMATGRRTGWHLTEVLTRAWQTLGGFIRAQALVSLIDAVFIGTGLAIIGVPLAMTLAIITFMAGFIPFVGAIVAGALSITIALVSLGVTEAVMVLVLVLVVQQLEGNVLSPWLQSRAMNLHPVVVLISVTIGSALFSLIGAFLAVPAAAMIAVVWRYGQEMLMLRSGEKRVEDLEFSTIAGHLIARYSEEEGKTMRAELRASFESLDPDEATRDGAADAATAGDPGIDNLMDVSAPPPEDDFRPSVRDQFEGLKTRLDHMFDKKGK
ncbi:AI-2E family transporter [Corynebacterium phocae]|nr:AI-2E family transporter [Corynebacterium phocae]KAA8723363.1 AI-2E family transporter [Corynebacterium phocae]